MELAVELADWTDWDAAAFALGKSIGLFVESDRVTDRKGTFWADNPLGNGLHDAVSALVRAGVLDHRDDPDDQYRWRSIDA